MNKIHRISLSLMLAVVLSCTASVSRAEKASLEQARTYFTAGAQAYDAGEYLAAIQAFEAAFAIAKRPGIVFSMAQSYRQQYYIDQEFAHLREAVENYRRYLTIATKGGRRAEAARQLSELNPLYDRAREEGITENQQLAAKTRIMVASTTKGAMVSLDGGPPEELPLIAEVKPGAHQVVVSSEGYESAHREIEAAEGAVVALDVPLTEKPAKILVRTERGARISLDGRYLGKTPLARFATSPGKHLVSVRKNGREAHEQTIVVERNQTRSFDVQLETTKQRKLSYIAFGFGAAGVITGGVFTGLAFKEQSTARDLLDQRDESFLTGSELEEYETARDNRNQWQIASAIGYGAGAACLITGVLMYALDQPRDANTPVLDEDPEEQDNEPLDTMELSAAPWMSPQELGVSLGGRF